MFIKLPSWFRRIPVYVQVYTNRIVATRLDTGATVDFKAKTPFSNERIVFAHFVEAEELLRATLAEIIPRGYFSRALKIVIQQMERTEGGLSSVERRALLDSCEHAGAIIVYVVEHERALSKSEALAYLHS